MANEKFGSQADRIKLTVRLDKSVYEQLHQFCRDCGASHTSIVNRAVQLYLTAERIRVVRKLAK